MTKNIVDVDTFTDPVVVPEGIDTHDTLAEFMEAFVQALANRTRWSKNIIDHVARVDVVNTFAREQIINTAVADGNVDTPILTTQGKPGDAINGVTPMPNNRWKLILSAPTKGDAWSGIFVGQSPTPGVAVPPDGAAMTNNARWHVGSQKWRQLDPAYPSTAMIGGSGKFVFSFIPAGVSEWTEWPTNAGGDVVAGGNIAAGAEYIYSVSRIRARSPVRLSDVGGNAYVERSTGYVGLDRSDLGPTAAVATWPIRISPLGATGVIEILVNQTDGSGVNYFQAWLLIRQWAGGTSDPTVSLVPVSPDPGVSSPGAGNKVLTISPGIAGIAAEGAELELLITGAGPSGSGIEAADRIKAISLVNWFDHGPRNVL